MVLVSWGVPQACEDLSGWPPCPRDHQRLAAHEWLGAELGRCDLCHGVLVSGANWQRIIRAALLKADRPAGRHGVWTVAEVLSWLHHREAVRQLAQSGRRLGSAGRHLEPPGRAP